MKLFAAKSEFLKLFKTRQVKASTIVSLAEKHSETPSDKLKLLSGLIDYSMKLGNYK